MHNELISHEIEVLEMLNGDRPGEWGSWVAVCLEELTGRGLSTHGPHFKITDKGRKILAAVRTQFVHDQADPAQHGVNESE